MRTTQDPNLMMRGHLDAVPQRLHRTLGVALAIVVSVGILPGCKKKQSQLPDDPYTRRDTEIVLEACKTKGAETLDANGDGRPEIFIVEKGGQLLCRRIDLNLDGKPDRTTFYDDSGAERRIESDFDKDGLVDEITLLEAGVVTEKHRATTLDGRLDTWEFYEAGKLVGSERDENGDGIVDQWWEYPVAGCPLIHADADGDGRPDPDATIDYCKETGYVPPAEVATTDGTKRFEASGGSGVEEVSNVEAGEAEGCPTGDCTGGAGSESPSEGDQ